LIIGVLISPAVASEEVVGEAHHRGRIRAIRIASEKLGGAPTCHKEIEGAVSRSNSTSHDSSPFKGPLWRADG
jgi:hypothetical protein